MLSRVNNPVARYYTVYPAGSAGRSELLSFLKAAYADQFNAPEYQDEKDITERWEWANIKNPNKGSFKSLSWICRENTSNKIVGHFGVMPISLKYRDVYCPAVWGRDLIVLPEFRKLGVGPFLTASVLEEVKDEAAIFMIAGLNDNDNVYRMYKKFGFVDMGRIPLYVRANRSFIPFLSVIGNFAIKLFYTPSDICRHIRGRNEDVLFKEIARFDDSFNKLWEAASAPFGLIVRRDSAYLNWRFADQPYWDYKIFKASLKGSGDPAGYIVLREGGSRGLRTGVITDIFASGNDPDIMTSLVDFAVSHFSKRDDIALIRCDMLNKDAGRALRECGFVGIPSGTRFMFTNIKGGLDAAFFADRGNWFLDYADSDLDLSGQRIT